MSFSQRIGKKPLTKSLQIDNIDIDLKNGLWNDINLFFLNNISKENSSYRQSSFYEFAQFLWKKFFKIPVDTISNNDYNTESFIRDYYFSAEWHEIYDFLEFLVGLDYSYDTEELIINSNHTLEIEFSAYRIINKLVCPISNTIEIDEIEQALNNNSFTAISGVNIHLTNALQKLSDRKNPDYRNSIKESISAIETAFRTLTGENTLGKALNVLDSKGIKLDEQLKSGYEKIYAFTNNKQSGIRHAIVDEHNEPEFSDAKYILLLCSAMVNYLVEKNKNQIQ
jgi:hypothetical protein